VRTVGHGETHALAMKGADGRDYTFRPVLKDPTGLLPPELRHTLAASIVRDQMASGHPAGHVIVPTILDAVGILHNIPRLCIMPSDPALGEFKDFAGLVGDIEEWGGSPGFTRSEEDNIIGGDLWKRLRASPDVRVDSRAYLTARLVDHLIGDWDRHRDQWRWTKLPGKPLWQPIPEDRDQAFVRFEGAAAAYLRPMLPLLVDFGPEYSSLEGLTFDGWDVDQRLLADLEKPTWDEVAAFVKSHVTNEVIENAVQKMPREYFEKDGARMIAGLKSRRDHITEEADRFYRFLAHTVVIFGTDEPDAAQVVHHPNGDIEVSVARAGAEEATPYFHRRFHPSETGEVRLYLFAGNDRVVTSGQRKGGITLRVVGGDGDDTLDDSAGGGTLFYDSSGNNHVKRGPGTHWDKKPYTPPPPKDNGEWIPARDWGRRWMPAYRIAAAQDVGVLFSAGIETTGYGFRKDPFADHQLLRVGYGTAAKSFLAEYAGDFPFENSNAAANLYARASGVDFVRFFGFGNETASTSDDTFFKVNQKQYSLAPSLSYRLAPRFTVSIGPVLKYVTTGTITDKFLGTLNPYGVGNFGQAGAAAGVRLDTTDKPGLPSKGLLLTGGGSVYPGLWNVTTVFGEAHGEATTYLQAPIALDPTLSLKVGGKRVWGTFPFFESAFLGGGSSFGITSITDSGNSAVRGLRSQRYAGDASLYASAELRFKVANVFLLLPGEFGVFGLGDVGRVYFGSEPSNVWHKGFGGGLWFATPGRRNSFSIAIARSEQRTAFYIREKLVFGASAPSR
jgi:hypothetical protein